MGELTPMMTQYLKTKEEYKDCILFYRLGDFYEMFFDDAKTVSRELELTLTGKACGLPERAPMCGVPYHAVETYLNRLIKKGYKVAICEQVEDPKEAKGLVAREVTRVVTPGTTIDSLGLDESRNNYLCSIAYFSGMYGFAFADITTGDFFVSETDDKKSLYDELGKFSPSEVICAESLFMSGITSTELRDNFHLLVNTLDSGYYDEKQTKGIILRHFRVQSLDALGISGFATGSVAAGALLLYLYDTQKSDLAQMNRITPYVGGNFMLIDSSSRRNLELTETMREKEKRGSLLWVLDKTRTAMGARMLRTWIEQPLIDKAAIADRLDAVSDFTEHIIERDEMREYLGAVYDLERLMTRITYKSANPKDLIAFKNSIEVLPAIRTVLSGMYADEIKGILSDLDDLSDLHRLIAEAISEDAPISTHDGGIVKSGYNDEVDRLRSADTDGKQWLLELEADEREKTGIKNLKIKFNKVFGYYLEVTNSYKDLVPDYFIRKQTLVNAERFYTPKLKELENTILGAKERLLSLENELYHSILDIIGDEVSRIQTTARAIARLDVFLSLSYVAEKNRYVRPDITDDGVIRIVGGRHPVVERMIEADGFIENDTYLDKGDERISIITGPNMAVKSTYMRQTALIVLMAQLGSFVPAKEASIGVVDRIFTRVGASDDLASGQSTFMVEMNEVANILKNATSNSLLILDEIGRGTSTFDGLSIAWAVVEHVADKKILGAKTLFATHYHELTELEGQIDGVHNYCIAVKENGDDIVFLRKIVPGGADKSYGIQVAHLAGVPSSVTDRAKEIVDMLLKNDITEIAKNIAIDSSKKKKNIEPDYMMNQMTIFDTVSDADIVNELKNVDVKNMTPLDALNKLNELQSKINNRF